MMVTITTASLRLGAWIADGVTYFASGSSAPSDLRGLARVLHPVGVSIPELSEPALRELEQLAGLPLPVFVDTGAFGEVDALPGGGVALARPISDEAWRERLAVHERLARVLGAQAFLVAPDRVGDQMETLRRLAAFAATMRACRALGARVVVPIQLGEQAPADFDGAAAEALGFADYVRAIPGNKAAMPTETLERFLHASRPAAVHLLGVGPLGARYPELRDVVRRVVPGAALSCDSSLLAALVGHANGRGRAPRALTSAQAAFEREDAVSMTVGPALYVARAMQRYRELGLLGPRCRQAVQLSLFSDAGARS